jgi:hypothetical protein
MTEKSKVHDAIAMDAKLTSRADSYEIRTSQVKDRPPAPAPIVRAEAPTPPPPKPLAK